MLAQVLEYEQQPSVALSGGIKHDVAPRHALRHPVEVVELLGTQHCDGGARHMHNARLLARERLVNLTRAECCETRTRMQTLVLMPRGASTSQRVYGTTSCTPSRYPGAIATNSTSFSTYRCGMRASTGPSCRG